MFHFLLKWGEIYIQRNEQILKVQEFWKMKAPT